MNNLKKFISIYFTVSMVFFRLFPIDNSFSFHELFSKSTPQESYAYTFALQMPASIKKTPKFCGYYKGEPLEFEQNFCIIHESFLTNHFSVFITSPENAPMAKSDGNNIKHLERIPNKPCKLYQFNRFEKDGTVEWNVEEENIKNLPLRIPDDSIILLLNPEYIESIEKKTDESEKKIGLTNLITLPKLVIKSSVKQEDLNKLSDIALLASLDLKAIHRRNPKKTKEDKSGTVVISMRTS